MLSFSHICRPPRDLSGLIRYESLDISLPVLLWAAGLGLVSMVFAMAPGFPQRSLMVLANGGWVAAFVLWIVLYWPIITQPRVDGKQGERYILMLARSAGNDIQGRIGLNWVCCGLLCEALDTAGIQ